MDSKELLSEAYSANTNEFFEKTGLQPLIELKSVGSCGTGIFFNDMIIWDSENEPRRYVNADGEYQTDNYEPDPYSEFEPLDVFCIKILNELFRLIGTINISDPSNI